MLESRSAVRLYPGASQRSASLSLVSLPLLEDSDDDSEEEDSLVDSSSSLDPRFPAATFLAAAFAAAIFARLSFANVCTHANKTCTLKLELVNVVYVPLVSGVGRFQLLNPTRPLY